MVMSLENVKVISSPIRWAGSKKSLIRELFEIFPKNKKVYVEPFLGSGVVLLNLLNNKHLFEFDSYYVNDSNSCIIEFFKNLQKKESAEYIIKSLKKIIKHYNSLSYISDKEEFYYKQRDRFNNVNLNKLDQCVLFFFLMKSGFNGVYRINRKGYFNVPFGKKKKINVDYESLYYIGSLIKNVHFFSEDYRLFMNRLEKKNIKKCFLYCDPPYIPDDDSVYQKQMLYSRNAFNHEEFARKCMNICKKNKWNSVISMSESKQANKVYLPCGYSKHTIKEISRIVNPIIRFKSKEIVYYI